MKNEVRHTAHSSYRCEYHIVFAPKYRRREIYGALKKDIGEIIRKLCNEKKVEIIEAEACPDHIHMLVSMPPYISIAQFMGFLKGKSTLMIFDRHANLKYKYGGRSFWCRGYYVDTVWKNAKNTGKRDITLYNPSLRIQRTEEQKIVGEFYEALYRDDFQMYLQPKFILRDRSVYGAEALARWKRPDGKILPPGMFIDSLEKIGYITELDFYIYEEVLKTLEKWDKQHRRKIVISTNFSGRHFESDGEEFLNRIQHVLSKYSVRPEYIEIEVTEGVLVKNVAVLEKCMNRLHEIGFRVAIDDFGTGYSSLSVLADMPADVIKIDKSFINKGMTEQKKNLLYEIGRMVKILHKDIIIEGVETEEQEQFLKEGGFTCGQGYLCNCPVPIGDFEKMYL